MGMECPRCHGNMAHDNFQDLYDDTGRLSFSGWRCMICGEILDAVIVSNRTNRTGPLVNRNRKFLSSRK
jgi:hypothetical protein